MSRLFELAVIIGTIAAGLFITETVAGDGIRCGRCGVRADAMYLRDDVLTCKYCE